MPTVEAALLYLGIDYADDMVTHNVELMLKSAWNSVLSAVGDDVETYLGYDSRLELLAMKYLEDLYSERSTSSKAGAAASRMVQDMELQLRLELARAKEGV